MFKGGVRVPVFAHVYTWAFMIALVGWPFLGQAVPAHRPEALLQSLRVELAVAAFTVALLGYARWRCSSENLRYWDGLLVVSASMMTEWIYNTLVLLLPALTYSFLASIYFAVLSDIRRQPLKARERFHRFVYRMYQNRMRQ